MQHVKFEHVLMFLLAMGCFQSQAQTAADQQKQSLKLLIDSKKYHFNAQSATSQKGRTVQLSTGYGLNINQDSLQVELPYYGRAYTSSYPATNDMGIRFKSQDFSYLADTTKKGGWDITIKPKGVNVSIIYLSISASGYCSVRINSNDRDPISYYGTIVDYIGH